MAKNLQFKKMKPIILKLSTMLLLFLFISAGCEKDEPYYNPNSIIGKWEWLSTSGGFAGTTYPKEGESVTWEFTEDSVAIRRVNNEITFQKEYYTSKDTLDIKDVSFGPSLMNIKHDTLLLDHYNVGVPSFISFYKRIK